MASGWLCITPRKLISPSVSPENTPGNLMPAHFSEDMGHICPCVENATMDFAVMKETFFNTIRTMHHNRISYPKPKTDATLALADKRQAEKEKKAEA